MTRGRSSPTWSSRWHWTATAWPMLRWCAPSPELAGRVASDPVISRLGSALAGDARRAPRAIPRGAGRRQPHALAA
jgi:hypothetical protein